MIINFIETFFIIILALVGIIYFLFSLAWQEEFVTILAIITFIILTYQYITPMVLETFDLEIEEVKTSITNILFEEKKVLNEIKENNRIFLSNYEILLNVYGNISNFSNKKKEQLNNNVYNNLLLNIKNTIENNLKINIKNIKNTIKNDEKHN